MPGSDVIQSPYFVVPVALILVTVAAALVLTRHLATPRRAAAAPDEEPPVRHVPVTSFDDVAGCDEAVAELREIKEYLRDPGRFTCLGASLPRGVLLVGPPGTGKTMLARALAGEAGVPFHVASAASFVEVYVGTGASRVRRLFEEARRGAPAIVFIDEIDAVGRSRAAVATGGQEERESTLNQLLVEMDGFTAGDGIVVVAATNRPDVLDPALLRPGRFDRRVTVDCPDVRGRQAILDVHARGKRLSPVVDLHVLAKRTPGFVGADLASLMNEAALLAGRARRTEIGAAELDEAVERVLAGPQRRSRALSQREQLIVAYHEAGHTLAAWERAGEGAVHKVSIVSRGNAHGYTLSLPAEERFLVSRDELAGQLVILLAGRVAEEAVFGDPTTGAHDDLARATALAHRMVAEYGMSERIGPLSVSDAAARRPGAATIADVDVEVRSLLGRARDEAAELLARRRRALDALVRRLLVEETLEGPAVEEVLRDVPRRGSARDGAPLRRAALRGARPEGVRPAPVAPRRITPSVVG